MVALIRINTKDYRVPLRYITSYKTVIKKENPTHMTNILGLKLCYLIVRVKN